MLKPYQRRAFLTLAVLALEPASASASDSLWDVLARADTISVANAAAGPTGGASGTGGPLIPVRRSLGPVPGFTLPVTGSTEAGSGSGFSVSKKRSGLFGSVGEWWERLESATGTSIKATGHDTLSLRLEKISGNDAAYHDEQYYGRGNNGVYHDADMTINATIFKYFHYETRFSNRLFNNPNDNRAKLDYNTKRVRFEWGDINAGVTGNSLIDFNLYLHGIKLSNVWTPQLKTTMLYTQTKAETRTIVLPGNNSAGPYYAFAGQIVEGSDHIRVDNRDMERGKDYTLDTYTGQLQFLRGNIIPSTSTIAVTFETLGFNQATGSIYGFRSDFTPRGPATFGLTWVQQQSRGSGTLQPHTQQFYGYGTPGATYTLDAQIDLHAPLTVTVDGVPLVRDVDYTVDAALTNVIHIRQAVPPSVIIQVQYLPLNTNPVPGNRSVLGLDSHLSLGRLGTLTLEAARSGLSLSGNDIGGHAMQMRASLNLLRNMHADLTLRDVSPTFSAIQSPGFNRNERSIEWSSDYSPSKYLHFNMEWLKAKRPSYSSGFGVSQFTPSLVGNDDYNQYTLGASYTFARNATLSLTRSSLGTNFAQGGQSSNLNDNLSLIYTLGSLTFDTGLSHTRSNTNSVTDPFGLNTSLTSGTTSGTPASPTTPQLYTANSSSFNKHFGVTWNASKWLNLSGTLADNAISSDGSGSSTHSNARDTQLSARLNLARNLRLTYTYDLSDTGNLSTGSSPTANTTGANTTGTNTSSTGSATNTQNGNSNSVVNTPVRSVSLLPVGYFPFPARTRDLTAGGTGTSSTTTNTALGSSFGTLGSGGYNANLGGYGNYSGYFGNTLNTGYGVSSFGGRSASNRLSIDYQVRQNMQLGITYDNAGSLGDYQYNSSRNNLGFNFGWQASERMQMNLTYSLQRVAYNGALGSTSSNTLLLSLAGHPFGGKLGMQVNWQGLRSNNNLNYSALQSSTTATTGATTGVTTGTTTGTTATSLTNTNSNLNSLALRLDYPISNRYTLFTELLNSTTSGYLGNQESDLRFGLDFALTRTLKFSLGWQTINRSNKDPQYSSYNYKVSSLLAEFGFRF